MSSKKAQGCSEASKLDFAKYFWPTLFKLESRWLEANRNGNLSVSQSGH